MAIRVKLHVLLLDTWIRVLVNPMDDALVRKIRISGLVKSFLA